MKFITLTRKSFLVLLPFVILGWILGAAGSSGAAVAVVMVGLVLCPFANLTGGNWDALFTMDTEARDYRRNFKRTWEAQHKGEIDKKLDTGGTTRSFKPYELSAMTTEQRQRLNANHAADHSPRAERQRAKAQKLVAQGRRIQERRARWAADTARIQAQRVKAGTPRRGDEYRVAVADMNATTTKAKATAETFRRALVESRAAGAAVAAARETCNGAMQGDSAAEQRLYAAQVAHAAAMERMDIAGVAHDEMVARQRVAIAAHDMAKEQLHNP
jgi:hypothetical protein